MRLLGRRGRTSRRGRARRNPGRLWIWLALVVTILVLLIDISIKSRSFGPAQDLSSQAWMDKVTPLILQSNVEGRQLQQLRSQSTAAQSTSSVVTQMQSLSGRARATYRQLESMDPPSGVVAPAGLLETSLLVRSQAAGLMAATVKSEVQSNSTFSSTRALVSMLKAAQLLAIGDQSYRLFAGRVPKQLDRNLPTSVWVAAPADYQQASIQAYLTSLKSASTSSPVHQIRVLALSTNPGPVGTYGRDQVLTPSSHVDVTVVVTNEGNRPEDNLSVEGSISPSKAPSILRKETVSLQPGQSQSIVLGPFDPPLGKEVRLGVSAYPPAGSSAIPEGKVLYFIMPSPTNPLKGPPPLHSRAGQGHSSHGGTGGTPPGTSSTSTSPTTTLPKP